ncbi:hypothetical protein HPP92_012339 [Vanilla planifolia]|uniref:Receptor-like serine/threonine-protein kinase n=1 Tax=Vanilla planifolia TaxID=51239 RepID=A0A835V390_VANPL|nr:hypothetical protein HPP92_012339 [Vanilla planifolia]
MHNGEIFNTFLLLVSILFSASTARDVMTPSLNLKDGDTLVSSGGSFVLGFFSPSRTSNRYVGIWYRNLPAPNVVWVANRRNPIFTQNGSVSLFPDGSIRIVDGNFSMIWSSPSATRPARPIAQLLETGNLVVKYDNSSSDFLWQSFDHPTDTMLPGMKLGPNLQTGLDRTLTAWASPSDPSPGAYTMAIDTRGDPQLVIRNGSGWIWRGGSWNGFGFTGAGTNTYYDLGLRQEYLSGFNVTKDEIYYHFDMIGAAVSRLTMDSDGKVKRYGWSASTKTWILWWSAPNDSCDFLLACGVNGVCNGTGNSSGCHCLEGRDPKDPVRWRRGDWSDGCVNREAVNCATNSTDEFTVVQGAKLPDTEAATVDMSLGVDNCRERCLRNCSCTAYAIADLSLGGNGCIMWTGDIKDLRVYNNGGQDLYLRVPRVDGRGHTGTERRPWVFAIVAVAILVFCLSIIFLCFMMIRRRRQKGKSRGEEMIQRLEGCKERNTDVSLFKFSQIINATHNFSNDNKLGEGGFGPVYKGKLEAELVAMKRLSARSGQGLEEFKNEVLLISKLQHRNLVRLLGYCIHGDEKILIYEYMPNKSLDLLLFGQGSLLDWPKRFSIVEGIAQGLLYLHKHSRLRIIHRDLKVSNILLDAEMNPKISDFGLARIFKPDETHANTQRVVGTYGYISPEYAFKGIFSEKSDVFSFGVLLLEIVSGKRSTGFQETDTSCNLLAYAWELWKEGTWSEFVDPSLSKRFVHSEIQRCIYVALLCVQESPDFRPVMSAVVTMLSTENLCVGCPKQPAYFSTTTASIPQSPFNLHANNSFNDLSLTVVDGR